LHCFRVFLRYVRKSFAFAVLKTVSGVFDLSRLMPSAPRQLTNHISLFITSQKWRLINLVCAAFVGAVLGAGTHPPTSGRARREVFTVFTTLIPSL